MDPVQVRYWTLCGLWSLGMWSAFWAMICFISARTRGDKVFAWMLLGVSALLLWCCWLATPEVRAIFQPETSRPVVASVVAARDGVTVRYK
jgi:hypothetical protein